MGCPTTAGDTAEKRTTAVGTEYSTTAEKTHNRRGHHRWMTRLQELVWSLMLVWPLVVRRLSQLVWLLVTGLDGTEALKMRYGIGVRYAAD